MFLNNIDATCYCRIDGIIWRKRTIRSIRHAELTEVIGQVMSGHAIKPPHPRFEIALASINALDEENLVPDSDVLCWGGRLMGDIGVSGEYAFDR